MAEQLALLNYQEPTRLRARAAGSALYLEARGGDRDAALDALVDCINWLDGHGIPTLHMLGGVPRFPVDNGRFYLFGCPLRSNEAAAEGARLAASWWQQRSEAAA